MNKIFVTKEDYIPLAQKVWEFLLSQLDGKAPSYKEACVIVGALEAIKLSVQSTIEDTGVKINIIDDTNRTVQ